MADHVPAGSRLVFAGRTEPPLGPRACAPSYHHLFRDMLPEGLDPELIPVLCRRAAGWFLGNVRPEEALEYSMAAGDADTAARLVRRLWLATDRQGRIATFRRWLDEAWRPLGLTSRPRW